MRPATTLLLLAGALAAHAEVPGTPWTWNVPLGAPAPYLGDLHVTVEKVELGRALFFDRRLSRDDTISSATCHDPKHGFAEPKPVSEGVDGRNGTRNAPTVLNATVYETLFWDGRAKDLAEQAAGPIANPVEMDLPLPALEKKLGAIPGYAKWFQTVYGGPITTERLTDALAAYEATLVVGNSPVDRFLYAKDSTALSPAALRGPTLYRGKARCQSCHALGDYDASFTDNLFHNVSVGMNAAVPDIGRIKVTGTEADQGASRPSPFATSPRPRPTCTMGASPPCAKWWRSTTGAASPTSGSRGRSSRSD